MSQKPTAVGVHIFAGGFTLGMKQAGFDVLAHLECSEYGVATSRRAHPELAVHVGYGQWAAEERTPDVYYGNPPCAPWSAAGSKKVELGKRDYSFGFDPRDGRVECVTKMMELLKRGPKVLVWESVQRAWSAGRPFIQGLAKAANDQGYHVQAVLHNGLECGVPQNRPRCFFVFSRLEIYWTKPLRPSGAPRTVRDAIGSAEWLSWPDTFQSLRPSVAETLKVTKPGEKLAKVFNDLHGTAKARNVPGRPGFLHHRLDWDKPSPVCVSSSGTTLYHPERDRPVSLREFQVLCGYPPEYEFMGCSSMKYRQVGQAVLPPTARWLGKNLARAIEVDRPRAPSGLGLEEVDLQ